MKVQRRAGMGAALVALGLAMAGAVAFACTPLSQIEVSSPTARPGEVVSVSGSAFAPAVAGSGAGTPVINPVTLRWGASDGAVLATVPPDGHGRISASFAVPKAAPGYHVILATQAGPGGVDQPGEPARAVVQVVGAGAPAASPQPFAGAPIRGSEPTGGITLAAAIVAGLVALAMIGAGTMGVNRHVRRPKPAPVRSAPRT